MSDFDQNRAVGDTVQHCPTEEFLLQVVDGDAEETRPIPNAPYILVLQDGTELQGETDNEGYIRRQDVPDGKVNVIIDVDSWVVIEEED